MDARTDCRMAQGRQRARSARLGVRGHLRLHLSRRPQGRGPLALSDPPSQAPKTAPGETSRNTIKDRAFIHDRPKDIVACADIGHWEGDLIICKRTRPMLVLHERKSRVTLAARLIGKTAAETISLMLAVFGRINPVLRKSITFDNDTASAGLARRRRSRPTRRRARGAGSRA